jgi:hypothetical protein
MKMGGVLRRPAECGIGQQQVSVPEAAARCGVENPW